MTNQTYGGGSGTADSPYLISKPAHLVTLSQLENLADWGKCFVLSCDIDMSAVTGFTPIAPLTDAPDSGDATPFSGVFDGAGFAVRNLTIALPDQTYVGLIGSLQGDDAAIRNLRLENCSISGDRIVGGIVGRNFDGTVAECQVDGTVSGEDMVGGMAGWNLAGTITDCFSSGNVKGSKVGGVVGANNCVVTRCCSDSSVEGVNDAGGLVGANTAGYVNRNEAGRISRSYATGKVSSHNGAGGLVGNNQDDNSVTDCYATGAVAATRQHAGGLIGWNKGTVQRCYATGKVASGATDVGGLIGWQVKGTVSDSFWDVESSEQRVSGAGDPKTSADMQETKTFVEAGWDFDQVWEMPDGGHTQPRLCGLGTPSASTSPSPTPGAAATQGAPESRSLLARIFQALVSLFKR